MVLGEVANQQITLRNAYFPLHPLSTRFAQLTLLCLYISIIAESIQDASSTTAADGRVDV
jgi:hypothetical protein